MEDLAPGWYPDPQGTSDEFRYWDGSAWSEVTTDNPWDPPPGRRAASAPPPSGRTRSAVLIGSLVAVVILAVAGTFIFRYATAEDVAPTPTEPSASSVGSPSNQSVSPRPDATPSATSTSSAPQTTKPNPTTSSGPCPRGNPNARSPHPDDDRIYAGNLSFPRVSGFGDPIGESRLSFAWDVIQQTKQVSRDPDWIAQLALGQLRAEDGFGADARDTANTVVTCIVDGDLYQLYSGSRKDDRSEAITIDDRKGWLIETDVRVDQPGLSFDGDHVMVVVVRDGDGWSMFFGAVPMGEEKLAKTLTQVVDDLAAG